MEVLLYYLLVSGATLALGALLGRWLFLPLTWHKATRAYYLIILLSAWIVPLVGIVIPYIDWTEFFAPNQETMALPLFPLELSSAVAEKVSPLWWQLLLPILLCCIWAVGFLIRVIRIVSALLQLLRLRRHCTTQILADGSPIEILPHGHSAFSAFGRIYLPPSEETAEWLAMYAHERQHARDKHYIDILLAELSLALAWWNPGMWLLRQDLNLNLEHIADQAVLAQKIERKKYQYILLQCATENPITPLYNAYNKSHYLKERIKMMNRKTSPRHAIQRLWLALPMALLALLGGNYLLARPMAERILLSQTVADEDPIYETCDQLPEFPGGNDKLITWMMQELKYPKEAEESSIQGRVLVRFIVEKDGSISQPTILRSANPLLDAEALRIVRKMPKWTPGKNKGKSVRVSFVLPVQFALQAPQTTPQSLYVVDGKVLTDGNSIDPNNIAEMRIDKSQRKVTVNGTTHDLDALGLQSVIYITTK